MDKYEFEFAKEELEKKVNRLDYERGGEVMLTAMDVKVMKFLLVKERVGSAKK